MKKLTALFLAILTLFCFTACAQPQVAEPHEASKQPEPTVEPTPEPIVIPYESEKWQEYDRIVYNLAAGGLKYTFINKTTMEVIHEAYGKDHEKNIISPFSEEDKEWDKEFEAWFFEGEDKRWESLSNYPKWGGVPGNYDDYFIPSLNEVMGIYQPADEERLLNTYPVAKNADIFGRELTTTKEGDYYYMTIGITVPAVVDEFTHRRECLLYDKYAKMMIAYITEKGYDKLEPTRENKEYYKGLCEAFRSAKAELIEEYKVRDMAWLNEINTIVYPWAYTAVERLKKTEAEYNKAWEKEYGSLDAASYSMAIKDVAQYRTIAQYELLKDVISGINSRGGDVYLAYDADISYYLHEGKDYRHTYCGDGVAELGELLSAEEAEITGEYPERLFLVEYDWRSIDSYTNLIYGEKLRLNGFLPASAFSDYGTLCDLMIDSSIQLTEDVRKGYSVCLTDCMDFEAKYLGKRLKDITPITQEQAQEYVAGVKEHFP